MASKYGKVRSYHSFVGNAWIKLQPEFIGQTSVKKLPDGTKLETYVSKDLHKSHIKSMNRLQGKQTEKKFIKDYMKSKGWEKVRITSKASKSQVRKAFKNQKIYNEAKARLLVHDAKKKGNKMTLKDARDLVRDMGEKYEGVGGSW